MKSVIAVAAALAAGVSGAPYPVPNPVPQREGGTPGLIRSIDSFRPKRFTAYDKSDDSGSQFQPFVAPSGDFVATAEQYVKSKFPGVTFRTVEGAYKSSNGIGHVYFRQTINGIDLDNADVNVNIGKDGTVFSSGSSAFLGTVPGSAPDPATLKSAADALELVRTTFGLPAELASVGVNEVATNSFVASEARGLEQAASVELVYYRPSPDQVVPAWRVETDTGDAWLSSYVQADGEVDTILAVSDYGAHSTFNVYPWPSVGPLDSERVIVTNPEVTSVDPNGWFAINGTTSNSTLGSNGRAQPNRDGTTDIDNEGRPFETAPDLVFDYDLDLTLDPTEYQNASAVQLFYTANRVHDVYYQLGFNEEAGNFQDDDYDRTEIGLGGDGVILNAQDGSGLNNANFLTPPDGNRGRMRMYIWNYTTPRRDASFDAGVIIHEYSHGLSNRLTGGKRNGRCLTTFDGGSMGEGWSDFFATAIRVKAADTRETDYAIGEYVYGNPLGIRKYPYSTSLTTNPQTLGSLNNSTEVHAGGAIWTSVLYEVLWNLIDAAGNTDSIDPVLDAAGVPTDGRYLAMKIVLDGLALQPCNPLFLQARDAIVDAEQALTAGQYSCEIWRGFAKRGWGTDAGGAYPLLVEGYAVPEGC